jgi:hypothetical protein
VVAFSLAAGCGGPSGAAASPEEARVLSFITSVPDFAGSPRTFVKDFTKGAAPPKAQLARYRGYNIDVVDGPDVAGETARATVKFLEASTDREAGTADWTLVREGEDWKLKSAPLP